MEKLEIKMSELLCHLGFIKSPNKQKFSIGTFRIHYKQNHYYSSNSISSKTFNNSFNNFDDLLNNLYHLGPDFKWFIDGYNMGYVKIIDDLRFGENNGETTN